MRKIINYTLVAVTILVVIVAVLVELVEFIMNEIPVEDGISFAVICFAIFTRQIFGLRAYIIFAGIIMAVLGVLILGNHQRLFSNSEVLPGKISYFVAIGISIALALEFMNFCSPPVQRTRLKKWVAPRGLR